MTISKLSENLSAHFDAKLHAHLIAIREHLHQNPELSFQEEKTCDYLYQELSTLNPDHLQKVAGTGVIARFKGTDPNAPCVALRGDIDALPIQEDTGLPYASKVPGVMHACGHDVHATWTIAAAHLISNLKPVGDIVILLQPAEELAQGAQKVLETDVLEGVDAIFGGHVDRNYPVGQLVLHEGAIAANSDMFEIEIQGASAHGARPHEGKSALLAMAEMATKLSQFASTATNPASTTVVSVGECKSGHTHNVIPGTASLKGTIRSLTQDDRQLLFDHIEHLVSTISDAHQVTSKLNLIKGSPCIINTPEMIHLARTVGEDVLGSEHLVPLAYTNLGAEDFGYYLQKIPGAFFRIGARHQDEGPIPAHNPKFFAEHGTIFVGGLFLSQLALHYQKINR